VRTALSMNFEPVASVVLSWIILGQRLSAGQIVGAAFVIAAITLAAWRGRPRCCAQVSRASAAPARCPLRVP
jgi:drug/metabolite transporter (DMT)-like permease